MRLIPKLLLPQVLIIVVLGIVSFFAISNSFEILQQKYVQSIIHSAFSEVKSEIKTSSVSARNLAAIFAKFPDVLRAYTLAHSGNIHDELSPQSQLAREMLRKTLEEELDNYEQVSGAKLRLHYHLPSGLSLVRLWRHKQTRRDGEWVDISDDISSFRQTVLDVNREGIAVSGIELGRGGFAIRGLVPVRSTAGILGSVEVLKSFAPILKNAEKSGIATLLFMNRDRLEITTSLRDASRYPVVGKDYILVSATDKSYDLAQVSKEVLDAGRFEEVIRYSDSQALGTMPVTDYKGVQIGVLVGVVNLDDVDALMRKADTTLLAILAAILLLPTIFIFITLRRCVIKPVKVITQKIEDIAEDKADLSCSVASEHNDEVGDLGRRFNTLLQKLAGLIDDMEGYKNVLNTVPDPVFAVDEDYNIIIANDAARQFSGLQPKHLTCKNCSEVFGTTHCSTAGCPIEMTKKSGKLEVAEVVTLQAPDGSDVFIQPIAGPLKNAQGEVVGYVEIARNVTAFVQKRKGK